MTGREPWTDFRLDLDAKLINYLMSLFKYSRREVPVKKNCADVLKVADELNRTLNRTLRNASQSELEQSDDHAPIRKVNERWTF